MTYPKVFLAVDNCFASKRWTRPLEWLTIARDLGICYVEASADTECDPLYSAAEYIKDWIKEVAKAEAGTGVKVVNLYSGHGTYATLGLSHTDVRVRDHLLENWIKPALNTAARLNAGLGFFCHAFPDHALQDSDLYCQLKDDLLSRLADISTYAGECGVKSLSVEQMYSPHQYPMTIAGAAELVRSVYARSSFPLYVTLDTGHASGQRRHQRPGAAMLKQALSEVSVSPGQEWPWVGTAVAEECFSRALREEGPGRDRLIDGIIREMDRHSYLFATDADCSPYSWLEEMACYSPIIHLQQTTGLSSAHLPFTEDRNREGIVVAEEVLRAIHRSYSSPAQSGMPPRCSEIYLTLELFSGTSDYGRVLMNRMRESVGYWRQVIPEDGLSLDQLVSRSR